MRPATKRLLPLWPDLVHCVSYLSTAVLSKERICVSLHPNFIVSVHLRIVASIEAGSYQDWE